MVYWCWSHPALVLQYCLFIERLNAILQARTSLLINRGRVFSIRLARIRERATVHTGRARSPLYTIDLLTPSSRRFSIKSVPSVSHGYAASLRLPLALTKVGGSIQVFMHTPPALVK